jgi:S1-C subfamily serine protease
MCVARHLIVLLALIVFAWCVRAVADERSDLLLDGNVPTTNPTFTIDGGGLLTTGTLNQPLTLHITSEKVKATYLGVETVAADDTLRAQLKLPDGVGLAVKHVEGPAKDAGVQQHDVLYKLNDQLLINTAQLVVLVRTFKPGDKVELTVIRQAQPVQLSATLVEKEVETLNANTTYIYGTVNNATTPVKQWPAP